MRIDLNGKKALVGGSTGGIGKAIALELSKCGANVTLMARDREKLKNTITDLSKNKNSKGATIVITTHDCNEKNMFLALAKINKMKFIKKKTIYYRIENFIS